MNILITGATGFIGYNLANNYLNKKNIKVINLRSTNIINYLPKLGFFKSRFTYFVIFFLSIFKLNRTLKNDRPDYLIIHLITFIPLLLSL